MAVQIPKTGAVDTSGGHKAVMSGAAFKALHAVPAVLFAAGALVLSKAETASYHVSGSLNSTLTVGKGIFTAVAGMTSGGCTGSIKDCAIVLTNAWPGEKISLVLSSASQNGIALTLYRGAMAAQNAILNVIPLGGSTTIRLSLSNGSPYIITATPVGNSLQVQIDVYAKYVSVSLPAELAAALMFATAIGGVVVLHKDAASAAFSSITHKLRGGIMYVSEELGLLRVDST